MQVKRVIHNKKEYLDLLLLADEQEDMIGRYLDNGDMFIIDDQGIKGECVVTKEDDGIYEIKNIAIDPRFWKKGYGKYLIDYVFNYYSDCHTMYVGTGDVPSTLSFYNACGFNISHKKKNFFVDNYHHPIFEDGIQLIDMIYLKREKI